MLIDELERGTIITVTNTDGKRVKEIRPPTSRELRAAREIRRLQGVCTGLAAANSELARFVSALPESAGEPAPIEVFDNTLPTAD